MSTNNRIRVMIGLTIVGWCGWATMRDRADADEPRTSSSAPIVATTPDERYLLLTNGQVIKGVITQEGKEYLVGQRVGVMRFPVQRVEGAFSSLRGAYEYRLEQLPDRDSDERIKLAHWCLNHNLKEEAREQLAKVLELNPKHSQAKAMLFSMEQAAAIASQRKRDPEVQQTGAETMNKSRPGALDSAVIKGAQRGLGISGIPVIFDLPTPLAIKRANEFARFVHPVLQAYCAKCHDDKYNGEFQLVPIRSRADGTPDAFRANLDATLRLINPESPSKSELLSSTLRAHGHSARPRPIFPGSNDKTYQILSVWVHSLRHPRNTPEASRADSAQTDLERDEAFAVERARKRSESPERGLPELAGGAGRPPRIAGSAADHHIPPPSRMVPGREVRPGGGNQAAPDEFPLPFVLTGQKPNFPTAKTWATPAVKSTPDSAASAPASAGKSTAATLKPGVSADAGKTAQQSNATGDPAAPKKATKPVTIDPKLLEGLLNRNIGR